MDELPTKRAAPCGGVSLRSALSKAAMSASHCDCAAHTAGIRSNAAESSRADLVMQHTWFAWVGGLWVVRTGVFVRAYLGREGSFLRIRRCERRRNSFKVRAGGDSRIGP
jgi:hypothetical protein